VGPPPGFGPPPCEVIAGAGYVHSLPDVSQALHVVLMPPLMHLTLLRRHLAQAMLERIFGCCERGVPAPPLGLVAFDCGSGGGVETG
jgi:hypothetical protein